MTPNILEGLRLLVSQRKTRVKRLESSERFFPRNKNIAALSSARLSYMQALAELAEWEAQVQS